MSDNFIYSFLKKELQTKLINNLTDEFKNENIEVLDDFIINKVHEITNGEIDFNDIEQKSNLVCTKPRGKIEEFEYDDIRWKIINTTRFKILTSYIDKINTSIRFKCNDETVVEYCPRYSYKKNDKFKKWFDEQKESDSGIKYDYSNRNYELPITWLELIENKDYFINKASDYSLWYE